MKHYIQIIEYAQYPTVIAIFLYNEMVKEQVFKNNCFLCESDG